MNYRIKELRKYFNISQEKFGKKIGVTKSAVSRMELGIYQVTDSMTKLICSEFNVSEQWLKEGVGEMFIDLDCNSLDAYIKNKNLTDIDKNLIKAYIDLSPSVKISIQDFFKKVFNIPI